MGKSRLFRLFTTMNLLVLFGKDDDQTMTNFRCKMLLRRTRDVFVRLGFKSVHLFAASSSYLFGPQVSSCAPAAGPQSRAAPQARRLHLKCTRVVKPTSTRRKSCKSSQMLFSSRSIVVGLRKPHQHRETLKQEVPKTSASCTLRNKQGLLWLYFLFNFIPLNNRGQKKQLTAVVEFILTNQLVKQPTGVCKPERCFW